MEDTLAALHAAVIDAPADRTVRLVYADALDECGAHSDVARAEFIRAQVALESMAEDSPERAALVARCRELFAGNWIDWWRPVCATMGLPEPHVPGRGVRERMKRFVRRDRREPGEPYGPHPPACSINCDDYGFTAQFIGGFPELLYVHRFTLDTLTGLIGTWFSAAPFCRLRVAGRLSEFEWDALDGPHLVKLTELVIDELTADIAAVVTRSPHLKPLAALRALPLHPRADEVRMLVHNPTWAGLRSLTLTGVSTPEAVAALAEHSTLEELEELTFGISEVPELPPAPAIGGPVGFMVAQLWQQVAATLPHPPGPIRWPDYWPALLALARSPVLPRLRRLRILDADPVANTLTGLFRLLDAPDPDAILSDECVLAVADALDPHKLERLELPAARLTPACREELTRRLSARAALA
jgi:uncharacterized protein (TIGR02996 family)